MFDTLMDEERINILSEKLSILVPQTWGEAIQIYPWILKHCEPHEWDNRTTEENIIWLGQSISYKIVYINNNNKESK